MTHTPFALVGLLGVALLSLGCGPSLPEDSEAGEVASALTTCTTDLLPDAGATGSLRWLGSMEGIDHLLGATIFDGSRFLVASSTGLTVVSRTPTGVTLPQLARISADITLPSNLDGATGPTSYHKFFNSAVYGNYVYVATRYDPIHAFEVLTGGTSTSLARRWSAPKSRVFTENVKVAGSLLYAAHHADGVEVMSLANPTAPVSLGSLTAGLTDSWNLAARADGNILVADGAAGVQWLTWSGGVLTRVGGETLQTSPGTTLDVAFVGTGYALSAAAGAGVGVYAFNPMHADPAQRFVRKAVVDLPGTCQDVEPMTGGRAAIACRTWLHVVRVDSATGALSVVASEKLHRRLRGSDPVASIQIGSSVAASGDKIYLAGWDHVDAYQLLPTTTLPDVRLSTQRVNFGNAAGTATVSIVNGGGATLTLSNLTQAPNAAIACDLSATSVPPGGSATLTVTYNGQGQVREDVGCVLYTDDPDDGTPADTALPIQIYGGRPAAVDPGDPAPMFSGTTLRRDYTTGNVTTSTFDLHNYVDASQSGVDALYVAIFGSWCPACLPVAAATVMDVQAPLPASGKVLLVDQAEPESVVRHVLEKVYLPMEVLLDCAPGNPSCQQIGAALYQQSGTNIPFGRSYVLDPMSPPGASLTATAVITSYDGALASCKMVDALSN